MNKPNQKVFLENLILSWGSKSLLGKLKMNLEDLDPELTKKALWSIRSYSEVSELAQCLDFDVRSKVD